MSERKKILVIDDEKSVCLLAKAELEQEGYQVETATDAQEGMNKIFEILPDLIVLDIMMPGTDGFQFCRVLKDDEKTASIPVIMHTGKEGKLYKFKGDTSGADAYVVKLEDLSELVKKVRELLD